jgi:hypothetical protein
MHRFNQALVAMGLVVLASLSLARPAGAQNPVPLPTDRNLAAYVGVSGNFQSVSLQTKRRLTMPAWVAAFGPGESFDFSALDSRAFLTLSLPEDQGWGLFDIVDADLTMTIDVTDSQNRLGSIKIYEVDSGLLVATVQANPAHSQASTTLVRDSQIRNYRIDILNTSGVSLSQLAVDAGKWDRVVPISLTGGFEPYYPAPVGSAHYTPGPDDVFGTQGDPLEAPGVKSFVNYPGFSKSAAARDYTNDNSQTSPLPPPDSYARYVKRGLIGPAFNVNRYRTGDPADDQALQTAINSASAVDLTPALANVDVLPYDDATARWRIEFRGVATAILAVPFERKRKTSGLGSLVQAIVTTLAPNHGFLSVLAAAAGNSWLADQANQQSSGFKQGDVMAWGDIYALLASERTREAMRNVGITQNVTFTLTPDIAPPSGFGSGHITDWTATTTPPPPPVVFDTTLVFSPYNAVVTKALPKGYKYKASANITSPIGYQGSSTDFFLVPGCPSIAIPCTLTKLLTWKIVTTGGLGISAHVTVKNAAGQTYAEGDSSRQPDGSWAYVLLSVPPGPYTVEAKQSASSIPPVSYRGVASDDVLPARSRETTITLTKQ